MGLKFEPRLIKTLTHRAFKGPFVFTFNSPKSGDLLAGFGRSCVRWLGFQQSWEIQSEFIKTHKIQELPVELEDLSKELPPYLRQLSSDDANVLVWHMLLLPDQLPYRLKAFSLRIDFPREYPLKPPTLRFTTKIYHPNISEDGLVCLPLISIENWKPYTKTYQVLEALNMLVSRPNLEEPVRLELADLLTQNPEMFRKKAEEFTLQFGVDRPV